MTVHRQAESSVARIRVQRRIHTLPMHIIPDTKLETLLIIIINYCHRLIVSDEKRNGILVMIILQNNVNYLKS